MIFSPGQVLEHMLGIDAGLYSSNSSFWNLWGGIKKGINSEKAYPNISNPKYKNSFPPLKCNLFLQHKRPTYISNANGNEYSHWNQPYFRYKITQHQQNTLYQLEQNAGKDAVVVYACPAFYKHKELWHFAKKENIVDNSNFVKPNILNGHKKYTFIKSGKFGIAHSEPTYIKSINLINEIDDNIKKKNIDESNEAYIGRLHENIENIIKKDYDSYEIYNFVKKSYQEYPNFIKNIFDISNFCFIYNIDWAIFY